MRECDGCTVCCTMATVEELQKPCGVTCQHAIDRGCKIYDRRPTACSAYFCSWIDPDCVIKLPEWAKPDRVGALPETMWFDFDGIRFDCVVWVIFDLKKWNVWRYRVCSIDLGLPIVGNERIQWFVNRINPGTSFVSSFGDSSRFQDAVRWMQSTKVVMRFDGGKEVVVKN